MKSRPCGWVFRLSRASRAVRERRLPCLCGLAGPSYERRLAVFLQSLCCLLSGPNYGLRGSDYVRTRANPGEDIPVGGYSRIFKQEHDEDDEGLGGHVPKRPRVAKAKNQPSSTQGVTPKEPRGSGTSLCFEISKPR